MRGAEVAMRCFALALLLAAPAAAQVELAGTWDGTIEPPGIVGGDPCALLVERVADGRVEGKFVTAAEAVACTGAFDPARGVLTLGATLEGEAARGELAFVDDAFVGVLASGAWEWGVRLGRASPEVLTRDLAPRAVDLDTKECPENWPLVGLDTETGFALDELLAASVEQHGLVGVALACVVEGELVDVRCRGWEDFHGDAPVTDETRFRWASISKPLTTVATARLIAAGKLALDADVRALVPEFPDKGARIRVRDILAHQSGITHYEGARRTWRAYEREFPFEELVHGLDLFATTPLRFAPGARHAYSTHAWTLLGVALERAAGKPYPELVRTLVLAPAGMTRTEPDFRSRAIAHRTKGYERNAAGALFEAFDDDIAWKLPGGGWTSTVGDLARFGAALIGSQLLDETEKKLYWSEQRAADGEATGMGLGFALGTLGADRLVSHSGGQRRASTFLAVLPERGLAVAAMCNTQGAPMEELALAALRLLAAPK